ncbi:hypothetical protein PVAP13_4NG236400 [Panicum virgatum]|uniref:Uncharacterized protein n=1 Tax=Panicum virgatum TaxID=38727 RepID=A0A8T0TH16_PANVG|nr:hypothetical protein PVAP13_4NG236400 [Panicum virgatum]
MLLVYVEDHPGAISVGASAGAIVVARRMTATAFTATAASRSSRSRGAPCTDRLGKDVWELCVPASCRWMGKEAYVS